MQIRHQRRCGNTSPVQPMAAGKASSIYVLDKRDEAIFQLNGNISNHNVVRYAPSGNPPKNFFYDKPPSGEKFLVHVWIGLVKKNLIARYFFDGNVNGKAKLEMLNNLVLTQFENIFGANQHGSTPRAYWFQVGSQDIF